jgi:hypothetical protein
VADDDAFSRLARELYWAEESTPRTLASISDVRNGLHDFAAMMRADERLAIPRGEMNLSSRVAWQRRLKLGLFRLCRPISRRYDRLLADHAELTTGLAERVQQLEAEVARLREGRDRV